MLMEGIQKEEYERARTEENEKTRRLTDEVRELKYQLQLKTKVCGCQTVPHLQQNDERRCSIMQVEDIHCSSRRISFLSRIRQRCRSY